MVRNMFGLSAGEHLSSSRRRRRSVIPDGLLDVLAQNDEKTGGEGFFSSPLEFHPVATVSMVSINRRVWFEKSHDHDFADGQPMR